MKIYGFGFKDYIQENWNTYKVYIEKAFTSSEDINIITGGGSQTLYKIIFDRLTSSSDQSMHLWTEEEKNYFVLTHLQKCNLTENKTLVLFSFARKKVIEKIGTEYFHETYKTISKFGKEQDCIGMFCYNNLDNFGELIKKTKEWTNVITRYQFLFPL